MKLDMKSRKQHLVNVPQRILLDTVFTRHESAPRPPVLLIAVLGYSPTATETEKAALLCEVRLRTHKEPNDLEVRAETPLVLVVRVHLRAFKRSSILSYDSLK